MYYAADVETKSGSLFLTDRPMPLFKPSLYIAKTSQQGIGFQELVLV